MQQIKLRRHKVLTPGVIAASADDRRGLPAALSLLLDDSGTKRGSCGRERENGVLLTFFSLAGDLFCWYAFLTPELVRIRCKERGARSLLFHRDTEAKRPLSPSKAPATSSEGCCRGFHRGPPLKVEGHKACGVARL
ncbi:hypothetical protein NDU88_005216 [Pleurodeles waltl]|uniref:Uncharacterized protein n=1 Tax=Pleurodeles waltl TaxID=8319 RepID=A0AAV7QI71_PLEWA|nr:hypothetical protein NDU88_005216 [Pleurodeles waltl]